MSILKDNYNRIIREIEQAISNEEERKIVKGKVEELASIFIDIIDKLANSTDAKIQEMEEKQKKIEEKMDNMQKMMDEIENDIYLSEEEPFDFEIVCPYCNYEFVVEIPDNVEHMKKEVECPECHNTIELDWNEEDEECTGDCHGCHGCEEDEDIHEISIEDEENDDEENNEDDM